MGGRRESHRPVTRSDLKQERSFFRGSVSTFLQVVVAGPFAMKTSLSRVLSVQRELCPIARG